MEPDPAADEASDDASEVDSMASIGHETSGPSSDEEGMVSCESQAASDAEDDADHDGLMPTDELDAADGEHNCTSTDHDEGERIRCVVCMKAVDLIALTLFTADEELDCDGGCGRVLPPSEARLRCGQGCDFDICVPCSGVGRRAVAGGAAALAADELPEAAEEEQQAPPSPPRVVRAATTAMASPSRVVPQVNAASAAAAKLIADAASRVRLQQQRDHRVASQRSSMTAFEEWRAQAAQRATALDGGDAAARDGGDAVEARGGTPAHTRDKPVVAAAAASTATTTATPPTNYALPTPPAFPPLEASPAELREQVTQLLTADNESRRRAIEFAREVIRQVPSAALPSAALAEFGNGHVEGGEEAEMAATPGATPVRTTPSQFQVRIVPPQQALRPTDVTWQEPCYSCDEVVGQGSRALCSALQLLASLSEELAARDAIIEAEMGESADGEYDGLHRAARFFMYRAFVAAKYGYLGHGNRVRIPLCVVTAIRARYRAAGCDCAMRDLASCTAHGYVGHRER